MNILLIYDIPHDNTRNKVSELCLDYGLDRVQYSSFTGQLSRTHQEELILHIKKKVGKRDCDIRLLPICSKDWANQLILKQEKKEKE